MFLDLNIDVAQPTPKGWHIVGAKVLRLSENALFQISWRYSCVTKLITNKKAIPLPGWLSSFTVKAYSASTFTLISCFTSLWRSR